MATSKSEKKVTDIVKDDIVIRSLIRTEEKLTKNWLVNWGWMAEEYRWMEEKMREKGDKSVLLTGVLGEKAPKDTRKLMNFPKSTNHEYGWLSNQKEYKFETYGPDVFVPSPLPDIYSIHIAK